MARVTEVGVRVDEPGHHHRATGVDHDRGLGALEAFPAVVAAGRDDDAVARRDPAVVDRADIAGRWTDAWALFLQRREREHACAADDEVGLAHPPSTIFQYESLRTILSPRNTKRSQPRTAMRCPDRVVPVSSHSEAPRSPAMKCRSSPY